nr:hypothetical protein SEVIR_3G069900v2 [Setaria viridis]
MKFTSATVASASSNSMPVVTICLALLLRMEVVKLRSLSGTAKVAGVALCLAGVFILAFYTGPALSPVNPHRAFAVAHATNSKIPSRMTWIKGTFFMVLANVTWALWIVLQSFVVAVVAEKDFSKWNLRLDISFIAIVYTGFVVTGVSYYLQAWCMEMKGPVFLAMWNPLCFVFTIFCSSFFLGEIVHLGSIVGGALLVGGLYSVLWAKSRETRITLMSSMAKMTDEMQDEQGHKKSQEKDDGNKEQEKSTSALGVEQV